jgi:MbtH protein
MGRETEDARILHRVVINDEEQYSIWPLSKPLPAGWRDVGQQGTKADCLAYVERVWTDMRPRSVREAMDGPAAAAPGKP